MTTWDQMSGTKRCWVVYREVCDLQPHASTEEIRARIKAVHGVSVSRYWLRRRLARFAARNLLYKKQTPSATTWYPLRRQSRPSDDSEIKGAFARDPSSASNVGLMPT